LYAVYSAYIYLQILLQMWHRQPAEIAKGVDICGWYYVCFPVTVLLCVKLLAVDQLCSVTRIIVMVVADHSTAWNVR